MDKREQIAALRARLAEKKEKKKITYGNILTIISGPIAFIISVVSVYITTFRVVDDVRVIVHRAPFIYINKYGAHTEDTIVLSALNAGTRTAIITSVAIGIVEGDNPDPPPHCMPQGRGRAVARENEIEPIIIKAGEVTKVTVDKLDDVKAKETKDLEHDGSVLPWRSGDKLFACLEFKLATAGIANIGYKMSLKGFAFVGEPNPMIFSDTNLGPEIIFKHTSTIFSN